MRAAVVVIGVLVAVVCGVNAVEKQLQCCSNDVAWKVHVVPHFDVSCQEIDPKTGAHIPCQQQDASQQQQQAVHDPLKGIQQEQQERDPCKEIQQEQQEKKVLEMAKKVLKKAHKATPGAAKAEFTEKPLNDLAVVPQPPGEAHPNVLRSSTTAPAPAPEGPLHLAPAPPVVPATPVEANH